jgi:acyl-CoA thioester hydrolase
VTAPWIGSRARFVFVALVRVPWRDCDPLGHANNASYLGYLEQAAIDHAAAAGFDMPTLRTLGGLFIARRHEIDYLRPASSGDWLQIVTWPDDLSGARATRAYRVYRLEPGEAPVPLAATGLVPPDRIDEPNPAILIARTEWAFVDPASGRPRRIPAAMIEAFLLN